MFKEYSQYNSCAVTIQPDANIKHWVIQLPYTSLHPYMSNTTLQLHYGVHHMQYARKLFELLYPAECQLPLEQIIRNYKNRTDIRSKKITNNACQVFNHNFFWSSLTSNTLLLTADEQRFKLQLLQYTDEIVQQAQSLFGSGYIWIYKQDTEIKIVALPNANIPEYTPIGCLDVWEHAYYLDYQHKRVDFVEQLFKNCMDWKAMYTRFTNAVQ
jgi:Fe-Mn family superoxide dismutase